ncbi:hypothetical protein [Halopelagius fulvigenes]|uniref:Uncharacterized protein n=1 Tax=Halopelagius fulvigenes TaxID=1198324 RepID=A0ABD5TZP9_9EURY
MSNDPKPGDHARRAGRLIDYLSDGEGVHTLRDGGIVDIEDRGEDTTMVTVTVAVEDLPEDEE